MADPIERCEVDVLVVGGGCSGAAAAIHDARLPITRKNVLIEIAGPAILIVGPAALLRVRGILDVDAFGASLLAAVMDNPQSATLIA